jgi:hypothetical protein
MGDLIVQTADEFAEHPQVRLGGVPQVQVVDEVGGAGAVQLGQAAQHARARPLAAVRPTFVAADPRGRHRRAGGLVEPRVVAVGDRGLRQPEGEPPGRPRPVSEGAHDRRCDGGVVETVGQHPFPEPIDFAFLRNFTVGH